MAITSLPTMGRMSLWFSLLLMHSESPKKTAQVSEVTKACLGRRGAHEGAVGLQGPPSRGHTLDLAWVPTAPLTTEGAESALRVPVSDPWSLADAETVPSLLGATSVSQ